MRSSSSWAGERGGGGGGGLLILKGLQFEESGLRWGERLRGLTFGVGHGAVERLREYVA